MEGDLNPSGNVKILFGRKRVFPEEIEEELIECLLVMEKRALALQRLT
jgi:hypothetical protein